jgi:hypothetical protein
MTTAATRLREIAQLEGFEVELLAPDGSLVSPAQQGLPSYNRVFERRARSDWTVNEWIEKRFQKVYPGYDVRVLKDDGTPAAGQMRLQTVRESYEAEA